MFIAPTDSPLHRRSVGAQSLLTGLAIVPLGFALKERYLWVALVAINISRLWSESEFHPHTGTKCDGTLIAFGRREVPRD
jgi:hypothetical protein